MAAVGIAGAANKLAIFPALDNQIRIALWAFSALNNLWLFLLFAVAIEVAGVAALWVVGASDKTTVAP